ncbi:MAG: hypothetical protein H0T51_05360, partial [Pirellulales bacterium]|nr:hypothetical protein [Pirellulales bacterium]
MNPPQPPNRCRRSPCANHAQRLRRLSALLLAACGLAFSTSFTSIAKADDIQVAASTTHQPITIAADSCTRWREGVYDVWHLSGNVYLNQGLTYARGPEAVLWIDSRPLEEQPTKVIAYFEAGDGERVAVDFRRTGDQSTGEGVLGQQRGSNWFQRMETTSPLKWKVPEAGPTAAERPAIYNRGLEQFNPDRRRQLLLAQYTEFAPSPAGGQALPPGMVKYQFFNRSDSPHTLDSNVVGNGRISTASGGVRVLIEGLSAEGLPAELGPLGVIDISTDRAVIWSSARGGGLGGLGGVQGKDEPLEIYMEGNIEFRQGDRIIYADRMFY